MTVTHPTRPAATTVAPPTGSLVPAVVQRAYGGTEVYDVGTVAVPELRPDQVLVEVGAAAIDRGTWHLMTGTPLIGRPAFGLRRPNRRFTVPGRDLAGIVVAVGDDVTAFGPGDHVHGTTDGSLARYVVARPDRLATMPRGATFEQAAALPVSGVTAFQAVVDTAQVTAGQHVLVTGASGGVGTFAVQIAAALGAEVTASCRPQAAAAVTALGATHVIDRTTTDPYEPADAYDVVIDIAGRPPIRRIRHALRRGGTAVIVGGEGGTAFLGGMSRSVGAAALSAFVPERLVMHVAKERGADLARLDELVTDGRVTPLIDRVEPLDRLAPAMDRLTSGETIGKIVIRLADA